MCDLLPKNLNGVQGKTQIFHRSKLPFAQKNMSKPKAPNIVKMGYEIYKYLSNIFIISKYWVSLSEAGVQLVPNFIHILRAYFVNLPAAALCSTRTQILFKSETVQLAISKYFCLK